MKHTVILEREEDGGFHAFVPALHGCHSQGETLEEAVTNIGEAVPVFVESLRASGKRLPRT